jgi:hypothetical protein
MQPALTFNQSRDGSVCSLVCLQRITNGNDHLVDEDVCSDWSQVFVLFDSSKFLNVIMHLCLV